MVQDIIGCLIAVGFAWWLRFSLGVRDESKTMRGVPVVAVRHAVSRQAAWRLSAKSTGRR